MRAHRAKKYRKIMSAYQLLFSFREPYQVLLDANFLRECHRFHMPLQKYLETTLHGQCRIFMTKCTLAKIMDEHVKSGGHPKSRPDYLPIPQDLPLRYCKHTNDEGGEQEVVPESTCLLDLLAGQPHGNEMAKNKNHYILASADALDHEHGRKGFVNTRERARLIPGVPVVYVKRSVMILEELSGASEGVRRKVERDKFNDGVGGARKRKREDENEDQPSTTDGHSEQSATKKPAKQPKVKGANPLSVRKKKAKAVPDKEHSEGESPATAAKSGRRKRGSKKRPSDGGLEILEH